MLKIFLVVLGVFCWCATAFVASPGMRPRTLLAKKPQEEEEEKKPGITWQGLSELVSLGLGAPNLGKFKGVDKETGTLNFELDSNRFISRDGKEYNSFDNSKATYFENGEVDESADAMGNFFKMFQKKKE